MAINLSGDSIHITPELARTRAGEYQQQAENIASIITDLDTLISELQEEFTGKASTAFADEYERLRPGFVQAQELAENLSTNLNTIADNFEEQDTSMANQLQGE